MSAGTTTTQDKPNDGGKAMGDYRQRVADELEQAWQDGEISHADACAELAEFDGEEKW